MCSVLNACFLLWFARRSEFGSQKMEIFIYSMNINADETC